MSTLKRLHFVLMPNLRSVFYLIVLTQFLIISAI